MLELLVKEKFMASRQIEFADRSQVETRDLAQYMQARGCPRAQALRAQAAAQLHDELPASVDKDIFQKLLEQRVKILGGN